VRPTISPIPAAWRLEIQNYFIILPNPTVPCHIPYAHIATLEETTIARKKCLAMKRAQPRG
jgi:hypothetical protein